MPGAAPTSVNTALVSTGGSLPLGTASGKLSLVLDLRSPRIRSFSKSLQRPRKRRRRRDRRARGRQGGHGRHAVQGVRDGELASDALTIVAVNGARQTLEEGATFPASDPVFVLVSEQPDAKSVVIGVVGGEYAGGMKTTKLKVGKPLTLVNTATGAQYRLKLVSVGSGASAKAPPAP